MDEKLKEDKEVLCECSKKEELSFLDVPEEFREDVEISLSILTKNYEELQYAPESIKNNLFVVKKLIYFLNNDDEYKLLYNRGDLYSLIGKSIRNDEDIALSLMETHYCDFLEKIDPSLLIKWEFIKKAIKFDPRILEYANAEISNNPELMVEAIKINQNCFYFIPKQLFENNDFVFKAIKSITNKDVFEQITKNLKFEMENLPNYLQEDEKGSTFSVETAKALLRKNGLMIKYLPEDMRENEELSMIALNSNPKAFEFLVEKFQENETFAEKAVEMDYLNYNHLSLDLKRNEKLAKFVVEKNVAMVEQVPVSLKHNREFFIDILKREALRKQKQEETLENQRFILYHANALFRDDEQFMMEVIKVNPHLFKETSIFLARDFDFVSKVLGIFPTQVSNISEEALDNTEFNNKLSEFFRGNFWRRRLQEINPFPEHIEALQIDLNVKRLISLREVDLFFKDKNTRGLKYIILRTAISQKLVEPFKIKGFNYTDWEDDHCVQFVDFEISDTNNTEKFSFGLEPIYYETMVKGLEPIKIIEKK